MQPNPYDKRFSPELRIRWEADPFDVSSYVASYKMSEVNVDGIHQFNPNGCAGAMISIRETVHDSDSPFRYQYDGFPMDEDLYVKYGYIISTNPDSELRQDILASVKKYEEELAAAR